MEDRFLFFDDYSTRRWSLRKTLSGFLIRQEIDLALEKISIYISRQSNYHDKFSKVNTLRKGVRMSFPYFQQASYFQFGFALARIKIS